MRMLSHRYRQLLRSVLVLSCTGFAGLSCFAAPETCHGCHPELIAAPGGSDGRASGGSVGTGGLGSGGVAAAGGGPASSGGRPGTGGMSTGGGTTGSGGIGGGAGGGQTTPGTGGSTASGGAGGLGAGNGAGGRAAGGTGGSASGGASGTAGAGAGGGNGGSAGVDPDLVIWYRFDEASGTEVSDAAMFGGTSRSGAITTVSTGTATFSSMARVGPHALSLNGTSSTVGAYVSMPSLQTIAPNAVTIACWFYMTADQSWQRVFDLGKGANPPLSYMFVTTHNGAGTAGLKFSISTMGNTMEQTIRMTTPAVPSVNAWHHVAVTLAAGSPYTGTLYIDRVVAGTNAAMTLHPSDLGATDQNYLGKSQFVDPYFSGLIDDFRVYRRALTAAEIAALPP